MNKSSVFSVNIYIALILRLLIVMLLFSLSRVVFYLLNMGVFTDMSVSNFFNLMLGGLRFDLTATLYTNALFIVGNIVPFRFRNKVAYQRLLKWVFIVSNSIVFAINSVDFIYFRFTQRRTTWSVVNEFSNDAGNFGLMGRMLLDYWHVLLIWLVFIAVLMIMYRLVDIRHPRATSSRLYYPARALLMVVFIGLFMVGVRGGFQTRIEPIGIGDAAAYVSKPAEVAIVLNTPFSILRTLGWKQLTVPKYFDNEQDLEAIYTPLHTPTQDSIAFTPKNVVIIILESMSREYIGSLNRDLDNGYYKGYTPFLDSLIAHSYTFIHAFANGTRSVDAMPSVLASIPSLVEHYALTEYSNNNIRGLASLLGEKGYDCSFFHGGNNGSMRFDAFAKIAGFHSYYGKNEFNNNAEYDGHWGIWDEPFMQYFAQSLNKKPEPFLSTVFTVTSHHPFSLPEKYAGVFPKGTEEIHQCIGYTDMALRRFFDTARLMPWFNNTLFVITADHRSNVSYEKSKTGLGSYSIPIIFYDPSGNLKGLDQTRTAQQIDIMPTVLNYLHYDKPYLAFGFDALSKDTTRSFVINYNSAYQIARNGYVLQTREDGPVALYHYATDILEKDNIKDLEPTITQDLDKRFKAFLQQYNGRLVDNRMVYPE